jgi:putative transposase
MQIRSGKPPKARQLARLGSELSRDGLLRLQWMTHYLQHGRNAAFTCRHFGISRQTFYRWWRRYHPHDLITLESGSHRPHRRRKPTWSAQLEQSVLALRQQFPRWGKDKLAVLLRRGGCRISISMVGRILWRAKKRGVLVEPLRQKVHSSKRPRSPRPYAIRKPKDYQPSQPGDLVQVDTVDLRLSPDSILKQFTARDVVSRWDVVEVHRRATSTAASLFLKTLLARMPFPIRAIQVDGGSEFHAVFEQACQQMGLRLFVLPPRSPKLNGAVKRANRTHSEEFYEVTPCSLGVDALNQELQVWESTYNTVRPHQALGYLTPQQFLDSLNLPPPKCH